MHRDPSLLAIDFGTQSIRAVLFDRGGRPVARVQHALPAHQSPQPGWAEQEPVVLWEAVTGVCQALWREPGVRSPNSVALLL